MTVSGEPPSRRRFLGTAGGLTVGGLTVGGLGALAVGGALAACSSNDSKAGAAAAPAAPVPANGTRQAGVTTPAAPQPNLLLAVFDILDLVAPLLTDLGRAVLALTASDVPDARLAGLAAGDLTITVGIGPRLVSAVSASLPGAMDLPTFGHESMIDDARGGDLVVQVCASDPLLLPLALAAITATGGTRLRERWRQRAARGASVSVASGRTAPRNVLGFVDGIVGPNTAADQNDSVWLTAPGVANATIMVVRRMTLDVAAFAARPLAAQEAVIGRRRPSSVPLSGGKIDTTPDLDAKASDGGYAIPVNAHVRRANAAATGVGKMLRRSYSMDDPAAGLLFISFQNELRTFTATMQRMQSSDALLELTTSTAAGTFLVLPGFDKNRPLGSTIFTT